jgi:hypothetical protein
VKLLRSCSRWRTSGKTPPMADVPACLVCGNRDLSVEVLASMERFVKEWDAITQLAIVVRYIDGKPLEICLLCSHA